MANTGTTLKPIRVRRKSARGQTMAIVALLLGLGVLIGLVAIAFDGGSALLQRRTMQNSAEAGAMAGINLMGQNVLGTCSPAPCHPSYRIRNNDVLTIVSQLASANRGGTVGATAADYAIIIRYHHMLESGQCPIGTGPEGCYRDAPPFNPDPLQFERVPDYVDGIHVTTVISNPTTFAGAIPNPLSNIRVSAQAAARLYPTCNPIDESTYPTLPFTRFRPAIEAEIEIKGNDLCKPFEFWSSGGDLGGNFKNILSFNRLTLYPQSVVAGTNPQQLLTLFDGRNGLAGGLGDYKRNGGGTGINYMPCVGTPGTQCADMDGNRALTGQVAIQDATNWIYWQWRGRLTSALSPTRFYDINSETWYPSNVNTNWGRLYPATNNRPGDWAETLNGNFGQNIQESLHDMLHDSNLSSLTPLSGPPLNWGRAITATVFLWGDSFPLDSTNRSQDRSSQFLYKYTPPCPNPPNCPADEYHWQDTRINRTGSLQSCPNPPCYTYTADNDPQRLRFTRSMQFVFYENLQGNYGAVGPGGCPLPNAGSSAWGFLPSGFGPDPIPGGTCGWQPANGTYARQIAP